MDWYKPRGYLHFDPPISKRVALEVVSNPARVVKHSFYPFVRYEIRSKKVFFDKSAGRVKEKDPKIRLISYAAHLDGHIYSYYSWMLNSYYERYLCGKPLHDSVLAFRKLGDSNVDFAFRAFQDIRSRGECCAIAIDVKGFFDNLDHSCLKSAWAKIIGEERLPPDHYAVYRSLTKYSFVERDKVYELFGVSKGNPKRDRVRICEPGEFRELVRKRKLISLNATGRGIPQGSPISVVLSNIYMIDFDEAVCSFVSGLGGAYYRYCDDILVVLPLGVESIAEDFIRREISAIKLEIQEGKTERRRFIDSFRGVRSDRPLQYLGFMFDGQRIYLRSSSIARYHERVSKGVSIARKSMEKINELRVERGQLPRSLYLKKLYGRYSYLGRRNFIRYGYRAADVMDSDAIRKQLKPHWGRLRERIWDS